MALFWWRVVSHQPPQFIQPSIHAASHRVWVYCVGVLCGCTERSLAYAGLFRFSWLPRCFEVSLSGTIAGMRTATKRIGWLGFAGLLGLWWWAIEKAILVADWLGRVALAVELPDLLVKFINWLIKQPEWVPAVTFVVFASILAIDIVRGWWSVEPLSGPPATSPRPESSSTDAKYMSLPAAAQDLYRALRDMGHIYALGAERLSGAELGRPGSPSEVLGWIATLINRHATIYGKRSPSPNMAVISKAEVANAHFTDGASVLRDNLYDKSIFWTDLVVDATEFEKYKRGLLTPSSDLDPEVSVLELFNRLWQRGGSPDDRMNRIKAFATTLRDRAAMGTLIMYGRTRRLKQPDLIQLEALDIIPREHWKDFLIWWIDSLDHHDDGNATLKARTLDVYTDTHIITRNRFEGFADLHVEREKAERLLDRIA